MLIDHLEVGVYVFAVLAIVWREKALDYTRAKVREAENREMEVRTTLYVERWHHRKEREEHQEVLKAYEDERVRLMRGRLVTAEDVRRGPR